MTSHSIDKGNFDRDAANWCSYLNIGRGNIYLEHTHGFFHYAEDGFVRRTVVVISGGEG